MHGKIPANAPSRLPYKQPLSPFRLTSIAKITQTDAPELISAAPGMQASDSVTSPPTLRSILLIIPGPFLIRAVLDRLFYLEWLRAWALISTSARSQVFMQWSLDNGDKLGQANQISKHLIIIKTFDSAFACKQITGIRLSRTVNSLLFMLSMVFSNII